MFSEAVHVSHGLTRTLTLMNAHFNKNNLYYCYNETVKIKRREIRPFNTRRKEKNCQAQLDIS